MEKFKVEEFFSKKLFEEVTELRVRHSGSDWVKNIAGNRRKRFLTRDGRLTILAADHPARMVTNIGDDPIALGNRYEFLGRILRVLALPGWDGIMGTTDIIEELLIIDYLLKEKKQKSVLDQKVMIGCMNRGGLKGTLFEMDDRFTSFTAESIHNMKLDGAKLMFRLTFPEGEKECGQTVEYCAKAIDDLNKYNIPIFLECLPVARDGYITIKKTEELIKVISVATALGDSSRNIWLKVPYCENFEKVALATTCPILILGGEARGDSSPVLAEISQAMKAGKNVRGVLMGRNLLFPGDGDPQETAKKVVKLVHGGRLC